MRGAMNIVDQIPPKARRIIYRVLAIATAVELALDNVGWGLIPNDLQAKLVSILVALGFGLALRNTPAADADG